MLHIDRKERKKISYHEVTKHEAKRFLDTVFNFLNIFKSFSCHSMRIKWNSFRSNIDIKNLQKKLSDYIWHSTSIFYIFYDIRYCYTTSYTMWAYTIRVLYIRYFFSFSHSRLTIKKIYLNFFGGCGVGSKGVLRF